MTFTEYQHKAQRTANMEAQSDKIINGIMGLCGEVGEGAAVVKKHLFQGHEIEKAKLLEEIGDVLWYCAELAAGLGMSLEVIAEANVEKLQKRYTKGFEAERSRNRNE